MGKFLDSLIDNVSALSPTLSEMRWNQLKKDYDSAKEDDDFSFHSYEDTSYIQEIERVIDDEDALMKIPCNKLKDYCRKKGIKGYGQLKKAEIVDLIMESNKGFFAKLFR